MQAFSRWVEQSAREYAPEDKIAIAADRAFQERRPEPTDAFLRGATLLFAKYSDRNIKVPTWFSSWEDPRITAAFQAHLIAFNDQKLRLWSQASERLMAELVRRQGASSPAYMDGLLRSYAEHGKSDYVDKIRAQGDEAIRGMLTRASESAEEPLRQTARMLACELGRGQPDDVPMVLAAFDAHVAENARRRAAVSPGAAAKPEKKDYLAGKESPLQIWRGQIDELRPFGRERRALSALGKVAARSLIERYESADTLRWSFAAQVFLEIDPAWLVSDTEKQIAALLAAEVKHAPTKELVQLVAKGLIALASAPPSSGADRSYLLAFASQDWRITYFALAGLKERLPPEALGPAVLLFVSERSRFNWNEINHYRTALAELGKDASAVITKSLEALLTAAKGDPAGVRWVQKVIAIQALKAVGDEGAFSILLRYAADTGSFESQETVTDKKGKIVRQETSQVSFRRICEDAIAAIEKRTGKKAPAR